MENISDLLPRLLLGDDASARAAAQLLSQQEAWRSALELAVGWHVVPAFRRRLGALGIALDTATQRELQERGRAAAVYATTLAHQATTVLERLVAGGVPATAFKGIAAIANLYHGAGARIVSDIDVLINGDCVESACTILREIGFVPATEHVEEFIEFLDARPHEGAFSGNHFLILTNQDQIMIDLHWRLGSAPPPAMCSARIIERAEAASLFGRTIHVTAPPDAIVLCAHHVLRDGFAPGTAVKDLCDLAAWWAVQPERWRCDDVARHAQACALTVPLLALWQILLSFDPQGPVRAGVERLTALAAPGERVDAAHLVHLFRWQLVNGRLNEDLLRLLSPMVIARFVIRRLYKRRATTYFTQHFEAELGVEPRPSYGVRIQRLLRDVTRLRPRTLAAYQALRRAHQMSQRS